MTSENLILSIFFPKLKIIINIYNKLYYTSVSGIEYLEGGVERKA